MCLLVVLWQVDEQAPLIVAANRDERLDRLASPMGVLRAVAPRVLGGRDLQAGGTWLAINEHGVMAGLTNRPSPGGRDPSKRSRGELPLALTRHGCAEDAVERFVRRVRAEDYNPAWLLVGDRRSLFALDMTGDGAPGVETLGRGVHVLENHPWHEPSAKVDHVRAKVTAALDARQRGAATDDLSSRLRVVLADHVVPPGASAGERPPETLAACVHTEHYGTRSSTVVHVPGEPGMPPRVLAAEGPPCTAPFLEVTAMWRGPSATAPVPGGW